MRIELASIFGSTERRKKQSQQRKKSLSLSLSSDCAEQQHQPSESKRSYFGANIDCHRRIVSHTISVVFYSHIAAHISLQFSALISLTWTWLFACVCVCFGFAFSFQLCLAQIITLSRMNNVCTKAWIWIFRGQKNTCSIVQFILHSWLNDCFYMKANICGLFVRFEYTRRLFHSFLGEYVNFHAF